MAAATRQSEANQGTGSSQTLSIPRPRTTLEDALPRHVRKLATQPASWAGSARAARTQTAEKSRERAQAQSLLSSRPPWGQCRCSCTSDVLTGRRHGARETAAALVPIEHTCRQARAARQVSPAEESKARVAEARRALNWPRPQVNNAMHLSALCVAWSNRTTYTFLEGEAEEACPLYRASQISSR